MKILITGGAGFIGRRIEERLKDKYELIIFDKKKGLDITNPHDFRGLETDCVIHLAALLKSRNPEEMLAVNLKGTMNVLEFCKAQRARLVFASSAAVYGIVDSPIKEEAGKHPASFYGLTKLFGEQLCDFYHEHVDSIILRFFNVYGPGQEAGFLIPDIVSQLGNERVELQNLFPKRDYIYVDDVAEAVQKSLNLTSGHTINIGTGKSYSAREIAEKLAGGEAEFKEGTKNREDIYADISKARRLLDWEPKVSLDEGLKKVVMETKNN